jgi:hypothetical protein
MFSYQHGLRTQMQWNLNIHAHDELHANGTKWLPNEDAKWCVAHDRALDHRVTTCLQTSSVFRTASERGNPL